jgi:hypothetical protein
MRREYKKTMSKNNDNTIEGAEKEETAVASPYTRWAATAVLVTAIPLLLLSSLALVVFYAAPTRFESILARLPGEAAIRTILIFAPVTLLAIIVLAVLYAFEKPSVEVTRPQVIRSLDAVREPITWFGRFNTQRIAWWILLLTFAILLFLIPVRAAAFLSPTHFENFLGRFPGEGLWDFIVHSGPVILLLIEAILVLVFVGTRVKPTGGEREILLPGMRWLRKVGPTRLAVGVVLAFSLPILLISLTSLIAFFMKTERFLSLIGRLPSEVPLRMGLIFIPASLIIVVSLAVLFLFRQRSGVEMSAAETRSSGRQGWVRGELVLWYLSWILTWVIGMAGATIVGLVIGVVVLILR